MFITQKEKLPAEKSVDFFHSFVEPYDNLIFVFLQKVILIIFLLNPLRTVTFIFILLS